MDQSQHVSTTAIAKALKMSAKRLFTLLKDYDWIIRENDGWVLLDKGLEQGGGYKDSDSFGRYIVWPPDLHEHPLLLAAADAAQITASGIGAHFQRSARFCNRVLRELGWIRHTAKGWLLTDAGEACGGSQLQTEEGMYYASWSRAILQEPELLSRFSALKVVLESEPVTKKAASEQGSLPFAEPELISLDGHCLKTRAELELCQWLYLLDLTHAYRRSLGGDEEYVCDFFLPKFGVYIDISYANDRPGVLASRLGKQQWCKQHQLTLIELSEQEVRELDDILPERLLEFGIQAY